MEIRVEHGHSVADAHARLLSLARDAGVGIVPDTDGFSGEVSKSTPLGGVRARYRVLETVVHLTVVEKPAFLPARTVERTVREAVEKALR